jgi:GntR family transcriptional regulator/MocR family aminotransferase
VTALPDAAQSDNPLPEIYRDFSASPGIFQMGVPAQDCFPAKLFARIRTAAVRAETSAAGGYPDPRGEMELRREIAAHLAISRSIECLPSQIVVTGGFSGALGLVLRALRLEGRSAWVEDPGYPIARKALQLSQMAVVPVPVDEDGIDVGFGMAVAPKAALAMVTPGQQAPLGPTLSLKRRLQLLEWASDAGAWIIEDDYLGELQLTGRAAPSIASLDRSGRVIHIGSFSKTLSPKLKLGFAVVPPDLAPKFGEVATCLAPAPGPSAQWATAELMRDGHYLRHLRKMKRVYALRRDALQASLKQLGIIAYPAGLSMVVQLPGSADDTLIAREAAAFGLAPAPLSPWYIESTRRLSGLLLGVTTVPDRRLSSACERLHKLIEKLS